MHAATARRARESHTHATHDTVKRRRTNSARLLQSHRKLARVRSRNMNAIHAIHAAPDVCAQWWGTCTCASRMCAPECDCDCDCDFDATSTTQRHTDDDDDDELSETAHSNTQPYTTREIHTQKKHTHRHTRTHTYVRSYEV